MPTKSTTAFFESCDKEQQQELIRELANLGATRAESFVFGPGSTQLIDIIEHRKALAEMNEDFADDAVAIEGALNDAVVSRVQGTHPQRHSGPLVFPSTKPRATSRCV